MFDLGGGWGPPSAARRTVGHRPSTSVAGPIGSRRRPNRERERAVPGAARSTHDYDAYARLAANSRWASTLRLMRCNALSTDLV